MPDDTTTPLSPTDAHHETRRLVELAGAMRALADRAAEPGSRPPLEELVHGAVEQVPGTTWASITVLRHGHFATEAASHAEARQADALQYELKSGPCVDAVLDDHVYLTGDITTDERWWEFGRRAHAAVGLRSVLAHRLSLHDDSSAIAGLNLYSDHEDAFDDRALAVSLVLATHGSLLVTARLARQHAENLELALRTNREIGVAMGILMQRHRLTRDQAFAVLRVASQDANRKLADIATEVADTGVLAIRRWTAEPVVPDDEVAG